MATIKITEELDQLQKKVAALKQIYKLYPDTVISTADRYKSESLYISASISKDCDTVRFASFGFQDYAYVYKTIGCIEVYSSPDRFSLFYHLPPGYLGEMKGFVVQNYRENMVRHNIPTSIIRECDLKVISYIKDNGVDLSKSNAQQDATIGKLLALI